MRHFYLFVLFCMLLFVGSLSAQWSCELSVPNPIIQVTHAEYEDAGTPQFRYYVDVTNREFFPAELFEAAPQLPPCGQNSQASRSWISIYDKNGNILQGYCAIYSPSGMENLWFAVAIGNSVPDSIYLEIHDRYCDKYYYSELVPVAIQPDLIISDITVNSYSPTQIDYEITVQNIGTAPVNMSGNDPNSDVDNIAFQGYISSDTIYGNIGDLPAGGRVVAFGDPGYLNPGESMVSQMVASVELDTLSTPFIVAKIDIGNQVEESDELNNTKAVQFVEIPTIILIPTDSMNTYGGYATGLTWDGNYLWQSDRHNRLLTKIDPNTKSVISYFSTHLEYLTGVAWDGIYLWCTDLGGTINKIDTVSKTIIQSFSGQAPYGITVVDTLLFVSYGTSGLLNKINPKNGNIVSSRQYAFSLNDMTFDGTYLWMVVQEAYVNGPRYIWRTNLEGDLLQRYRLKNTSSVPTGITFDGTQLFITDIRTDKIYYVSSPPLSIADKHESSSHINHSFDMVSAWPNPFNPQINISFKLKRSEEIRVQIYDLIGRNIKNIFQGVKSPGDQTFTWNGTNENSQRVSSGVYFIRVQAGNQSIFKKIIFLK